MRSMRTHKKWIVIGGIGIILVGVLVGKLFLGQKEKDEVGRADAAYAQEVIKDGPGGGSRIDGYAGTKSAYGQSDPAAYLADHSTFLIDQDAVESYVSEQIAGLESTSFTTGQGIEELLLEKGYDSLDDYRQDLMEETSFYVKKRLCIYRAAKDLRLRISEDEYTKLLPSYAQNYGFDSAEAFSYVCLPGSIASEMLYDKTVDVLKEM